MFVWVEVHAKDGRVSQRRLLPLAASCRTVGDLKETVWKAVHGQPDAAARRGMLRLLEVNEGAGQEMVFTDMHLQPDSAELALFQITAGSLLAYYVAGALPKERPEPLMIPTPTQARVSPHSLNDFGASCAASLGPRGRRRRTDAPTSMPLLSCAAQEEGSLSWAAQQPAREASPAGLPAMAPGGMLGREEEELLSHTIALSLAEAEQPPARSAAEEEEEALLAKTLALSLQEAAPPKATSTLSEQELLEEALRRSLLEAKPPDLGQPLHILSTPQTNLVSNSAHHGAVAHRPANIPPPAAAAPASTSNSFAVLAAPPAQAPPAFKHVVAAPQANRLARPQSAAVAPTPMNRLAASTQQTTVPASANRLAARPQPSAVTPTPTNRLVARPQQADTPAPASVAPNRLAARPPAATSAPALSVAPRQESHSSWSSACAAGSKLAEAGGQPPPLANGAARSPPSEQELLDRAIAESLRLEEEQAQKPKPREQAIVEVPNDLMGHVLGKKFAKLTALERKTGAKITVPPREDGAPMAFLVIEGRSDRVREAERELTTVVAGLQQRFGGGGGSPSGGAELHVFVDLSNILLGFAGGGNVYDFLHSFRVEGLVDTIVQGRKADTLCVAGSFPAEHSLIWEEFRRLKFETHVDMRGGSERFVDEFLHAQILRRVCRRVGDGQPPRTLVLLTGDGNANGGQSNFPECVEIALENNWNVELWSWRKSTSSRFYRIAKGKPQQMAVFELDAFREDIAIA